MVWNVSAHCCYIVIFLQRDEEFALLFILHHHMVQHHHAWCLFCLPAGPKEVRTVGVLSPTVSVELDVSCWSAAVLAVERGTSSTPAKFTARSTRLLMGIIVGCEVAPSPVDSLLPSAVEETRCSSFFSMVLSYMVCFWRSIVHARLSPKQERGCTAERRRVHYASCSLFITSSLFSLTKKNQF